MSKEDSCDSMRDMSFDKEENIEIEGKYRVEEKECLVEKSSYFDSISSLDLVKMKSSWNSKKNFDLTSTHIRSTYFKYTIHILGRASQEGLPKISKKHPKET
ncbi:hypothetical protein M9H77_23712 [Catharanthus roseus]|uniref:Uncharacterized protein n=1 Tax=Catharanthus roseus TaxID=4058 RepID=A0ACC0AU17_CATRO|nr:hypothetical protein M9H77_23712 [Catharanthus roseus]